MFERSTSSVSSIRENLPSARDVVSSTSFFRLLPPCVQLRPTGLTISRPRLVVVNGTHSRNSVSRIPESSALCTVQTVRVPILSHRPLDARTRWRLQPESLLARKTETSSSRGSPAVGWLRDLYTYASLSALCRATEREGLRDAAFHRRDEREPANEERRGALGGG